MYKYCIPHSLMFIPLLEYTDLLWPPRYYRQNARLIWDRRRRASQLRQQLSLARAGGPNACNAVNASLAYNQICALLRYKRWTRGKPAYLAWDGKPLATNAGTGLVHFMRDCLSPALALIKAERRWKMHARSQSKWVSIEHWIERVERMGSTSSRAVRVG